MLSPLVVGLAASTCSIGFGIGPLGVSYAVCALIPGLFIQEKIFDPNAVEPQLGAPGMQQLIPEASGR
jgi:hypothetical protein